MTPLTGHTNAILQIKWGRDKNWTGRGQESCDLYSCGAQDNGNPRRGELFLWDLCKFERKRKFRGHNAIVNSIDTNQNLLCSASDDCTAKIWDVRSKNAIKCFKTAGPSTAVALSRDNEYLFIAGVDNEIKCVNLTRNQVDFTLWGH